MKLTSAFFAGLLFGLGLLVSGMSNPAKVTGFLDLAGAWDPSLALVMASAIGVGLFAFRAAGKRSHTLLGESFSLPAARLIDTRLVLGSALFGIGWGLGGFCPGPALAGLLSGSLKPLLFVVAMVAGMAVFELFERRARLAAADE